MYEYDKNLFSLFGKTLDTRRHRSSTIDNFIRLYHINGGNGSENIRSHILLRVL